MLPLKLKEHFILDSQYKQQRQESNVQIAELSKQKTETWIRAIEYYARFVRCEISKETFQAVQNVANSTLKLISDSTKRRDSYEKQYAIFRKLLSASDK